MISESEIARIIDEIRYDIARGAQGLEFYPDSHTYIYNGVEMPPVSEVCKQFEQTFDSDYWARRKAQETGQSASEVLKSWEDGSRRACEEGTEVHAYAQWHFHRHTGVEITDSEVVDIEQAIAHGTLPDDPRLRCVDRFWEYIAQINTGEYRLYPIAAENRIVHPELGYAGTFDLLCLCVSPDDTLGLIIFDYKTNGNLFNIFRRRDGRLTTMLSPLDDTVACNAALYTCQLNLYQLGLQRVTDIPVVARRLVWVEPEGVAAIHANTTEVYLATHRQRTSQSRSSKWKFFPYYTHDITRLKHLYRFAANDPQGHSFATLSLPDLSDRLYNFLSTKK